MIACLDVHYGESTASAAGLVFADWEDERRVDEAVVTIDHIEPYTPGEFFRRELPCLLAVLRTLRLHPSVIVIDGYVWLGDEGEPGLEGHLYEALECRVGVIGVAKTRFHHAKASIEITRGQSHSPLYITAAGFCLDEAAHRIQEMRGPFRIPSLLKRVDQLCRGIPVHDRRDSG